MDDGGSARLSEVEYFGNHDARPTGKKRRDSAAVSGEQGVRNSMDPDPDEHVHPGQEDLQWGPVKESERSKGGAPTAKYNKLSEKARRMMAGESQCAMFCGGKKCKYCTADNWKPEQMVIKGLYSEWVTDNILAMARPSNSGIEKYNILEQFQENNIKTVINLQQPGEHASCGFGNDSSGFSYNPQLLMEKEIFFYNFAWQDYGIAPMSTLLDIVKVMQFSVSMGKVAVHCHAGLGRTGLLIACYLVYNNRMNSGDAVRYVRSRRPGAIQTSQQVQTVSDFETHLKPFRTIFPSKIPGASEVSFKHFLNRQSHLLHGFEARKLRHIPKVVYVCCERLLELAGKSKALSRSRASSKSTMHSGIANLDLRGSDLKTSFSKLSVHSDMDLKMPHVQPQHMQGSKSFEDLPNARLKGMLLQPEEQDTSSRVGSTDLTLDGYGINGGVGLDDSYDNLSDADGIVFGANAAERVDNEKKKDKSDSAPEEGKCGGSSDQSKSGQPESSQSQSDSQLSKQVADSGRQSSPSTSDQNPTDSSVSNGNDPDRKRKFKKKGLVERLKGRSKRTEEGKGTEVTENEEGTSNWDEQSIASEGKSDIGSSGRKSLLSSTVNTTAELKICKAMAASAMEYSDEARQKADNIEDELNQSDTARGLLHDEKDPYVLCAVLYDWLDQLKEPVLSRQSLALLLERTDSPKERLHHLEKSVKHFTEYLALVLSKLFPQPPDIAKPLTERLLSNLTHMNVAMDLSSFTQPYQPTHWGEMKNTEAQHLIDFFFKLIDEMSKSKKSEQ